MDITEHVSSGRRNGALSALAEENITDIFVQLPRLIGRSDVLLLISEYRLKIRPHLIKYTITQDAYQT